MALLEPPKRASVSAVSAPKDSAPRKLSAVPAASAAPTLLAAPTAPAVPSTDAVADADASGAAPAVDDTDAGHDPLMAPAVISDTASAAAPAPAVGGRVSGQIRSAQAASGVCAEWHDW